MKKNSVCAIGLGGYSVFMSVDHFHACGETVRADAIYAEPGGKAYNQAVAAARLGAPSVFIGAFGEDSNKDFCIRFLDGEKVDYEIMLSQNSGTAYACILTDSEGDNRVTVYSGAADELSGAFIRSKRKMFENCSVLLAGFECPFDAVSAALDAAEEYGTYTILNPAPARFTDIDFIRRFNLITPNVQEAAVLLSLSDDSPKSICRALTNNGIRSAAVTLGKKGALLCDEGRYFLYDGIKCNAVDTTGAGDCFNGALACAISKGLSLKESVEFAVNASALSVTKPHVMTALPTADEVYASYQRIKPREIFL